MKPFDYADEKIGQKEIGFALPSLVIGVSILSLPRVVADTTKFADGWVSVLIAGLLSLLFTWITATLVSRFPNQSFLDYSSKLISKPLALSLTLFMILYFVLFTAFEINYIAILTKQYLLDETPKEIISFVFLLLVIYAVAGSRAALFRLNILFLPIVVIVLLILLIGALSVFDPKHLFPLFKTNWMGYLKGVKGSFLAMTGWEILLIYSALIRPPVKAVKPAIIGMCVPIILYLLLYIVTIGVYSNIVTRNLVFPTVELAKEVEIPGGIFERAETLFFTVWIMTIFSTASIFYDVSVMTISSIFKKTKKAIIIFILAPIIYVISMLPKSFIEVTNFGHFISFMAYFAAFIIPALLLLIAKIRRIREDKEGMA
ncbi:spore germination protein [Scopulibacillus darangshiensis]|uniref:Spore germination protein n=1 Tax=Scopulibacillus darangshiensis TaxID=442528 RepID=A0A4R2P5G9_9BACL|nr:endospore germination permease [Scopulibacillus darangshiensis]TCP30032.1 spore germination protein [Scopulibacillus darangshiensis]